MIIFSSCSSNSISEPEVTDCDCKIVTYKVTVNDYHTIVSESKVTTKCINDALVFGKKYSGNRLVHYSIYVCN